MESRSRNLEDQKRPSRQRRESTYDFQSKTLPNQLPDIRKSVSSSSFHSCLSNFNSIFSPTLPTQPENLTDKIISPMGSEDLPPPLLPRLSNKSSLMAFGSNKPTLPPRSSASVRELDINSEKFNNSTASSSLRSYQSLSNSENPKTTITIESPIHPSSDTPFEKPLSSPAIPENVNQWPHLLHLQEPKTPLQKRTSLSRLTMLGLDANLAKSNVLAHPGLLSEIIKRFKKTSQEVMTGSQILDFFEKAAGLPPKDRVMSHRISQTLQPFALFKHTVDDELPILDGDEELYVVNINKLQNPSFTPRSVLTYLTPCYMPTCSKNFQCCNPRCPTKWQFSGRPTGELRVINVAPSSNDSRINHSKNSSSFDGHSMVGAEMPGSLNDSGSDKFSKEAELWIQAVPREISDKVSDDEKKRQELIYETIKTEADFVNDLQLIDKIFVNSMRRGEVYDKNRVEAVLITLFSNYTEILSINFELLEALKERQRQSFVVSSVGDIFFKWALRLDSYVHYGSRLAYAQDFIKKEIEFNAGFALYLKECERHPDARRLSIQSFVGRATTRLGRYPLLLEGILKKTASGNPDLELIPQALALVRSKLEEVNRSAGEAEERLKLSYINSHLYFKPEDRIIDIDLESKGRRLLKEGILRRAGGHGSQPIIAFLFDNGLVLAKEKKKVVTEYRAICPAIPLYTMQVHDEVSSRSFKLAESLMLSQKASSDLSTTLGSNSDNNGFGFSITHHGKRTNIYYLLATSNKERTQWTEALNNAREACPQFSIPVLNIQEVYQSHATQNHILASTRCHLDGEDHYLFGCDNGVYLLTKSGALKRIIKSTTKVVQLEALLEYHILVVLFGDKYLMAYQLDVVTDLSGKFSTVHTKLSENVNFFRIGMCNYRLLLISAKYHSQKSNFKTMQFVRFSGESKASLKNKLLWQSRHGTGLRVVKKFYVGTIGNGISFLRTKLVIACGPGFEIVDLEALYLNRGIPDRTSLIIQSNPRLSALFENCTPLAMYRINPTEFLLCYKEFGFYVDNNGRPSRELKSVLEWNGVPNNFIYNAPFIICFDSDMIEVRRADTGDLSQVIMTGSLQFTNPSHSFTQELHAVAEIPGVANGQRFFRLGLVPNS